MECPICGRSDNGCYSTPDEIYCHTEEMEMADILSVDLVMNPQHGFPPGGYVPAFTIDDGTVVSIDQAVEEHKRIMRPVQDAFASLGCDDPVEFHKLNGAWITSSGKLFIYYDPNLSMWQLTDPMKGNVFEGTTWTKCSQDLQSLVDLYLSEK